LRANTKQKWRIFISFFSSSSFLPPPSLNVSISANIFPLSSGANSATRAWRFLVDGAVLFFALLSRMLFFSLSLSFVFGWQYLIHPCIFSVCLGGALLRRTYTKASSEVALYIAEDTSIREGTNRSSLFDTVVVLFPYGTTWILDISRRTVKRSPTRRKECVLVQVFYCIYFSILYSIAPTYLLMCVHAILFFFIFCCFLTAIYIYTYICVCVAKSWCFGRRTRFGHPRRLNFASV